MCRLSAVSWVQYQDHGWHRHRGHGRSHMGQKQELHIFAGESLSRGSGPAS